MREKKVSAYKSHDAHILLHYLLQVAVRKTLPKHVAVPLIKFGAFFQKLCSKVVNPKDLESLQSDIVTTLCELEKNFLPCFFDIMEHLPVHLVDEVRLGGPVHGRCMYFIERYLCTLKSSVRNRGRPEGSIAEGYLMNECMVFCSRYLHGGVKTPLNKGLEDMLEDEANDPEQLVFKNVGHPLGGKKTKKGWLFTLDIAASEQAHRYALFNSDCKEVDQYIKEHKVYVNRQRRKSKWARAQHHSRDFANWLKEKVINNTVPDHIFWLAKGPSPTARRYKGYYANGYKFYTKSRDTRCKTQNSGVTLAALTPSFASSRDKNPIVGNVTYYGSILEIIEISYWSKFSVVLFRCEWYQVEKDDFGLTCVNVNKFCSQDDPFVLPSQVHQVFYVADPIVDGLHYVMHKVPRDVYDIDNEEADGDNNSWCGASNTSFASITQFSDEDINVSRDDIAATILDASKTLADVDGIQDQNEDDSDYDDTLWDWMESN